MEKSIILAGLGGQGVLVAGQTISNTANEDDAYEFVTYFPSYGMQKRGGTSDCYVVMSNEQIGIPKPSKADYLLAFNEGTFERFKSHVKPGGVIFVNTEEDLSAEGITVVKVGAEKVAYDLGSPRVLNLVMTGALIGYSELLPADKILQYVLKKLGAKHPEFNEMNEKAYAAGIEIGKGAI